MRLLVSIALAAAGYAGINLTDIEKDAAEATSLSREAPTRFELQLVGASKRCGVEKSERVESDLYALKLGSGCRDVYPALARAKSWREREDGSLALSSPDGEPVVVFAVSDGLAFESIEPANPILTLTSSH